MLNSKLRTQTSKLLSDWHCHILPGLDDGPATMDESMEIAAALRKAGFASVYCTPHLIKGGFDADNGAVRETLTALQTRLHDENIGLWLLPGREYYLDEFLFDYLKDPMPLGETKYIMLELPHHIAPEFVKEACFRIKCSGFIPMIAHPERCSLFAMLQKQANAWLNLFNSELKIENSKLLTYLISLGCAFQANLGSFAGWYGSQVEQKANSLKEKKVYTHFGTDAHSADSVKSIMEGSKKRNVKSEG